MNHSRILIAPIPGYKNGPAISLLRLKLALKMNGYKTTSTPFRALGHPILPWKFGIIMGVPVHYEKLLTLGKPIINIIGKPQREDECAAYGKIFTHIDDINNQAMSKVIEHSSNLVFISDYVKEIWRRWYFEQGRVFPAENSSHVIYHGLDLDQFSPIRRETKFEPFVIGCFGAMRSLVRIRAIYEVSQRLTFAHEFLIIGTTTLECEVEIEKLRNLGVKFRRIQWVKANKLHLFFNQIDCLLHPVDYEGFGIVVSEAMASGVPVAVPEFGGAAEISKIQSLNQPVFSTEQFRYDESFYDLLADRVSKIYCNWSIESTHARKIAIERFDIKKIAKRFIDISEGWLP